MEYYAGAREEQLLAAAKALAAVVRARPTGAFAIGNAGAIRSTAKLAEAVTIRVVWAATREQPAKAHVYGVPPDDMIVLHALATEAWAQMLPAAQVL
jgi:hypothetical protein